MAARRAGILALALVLTLAVAACGKKGDLKPPPRGASLTVESVQA